MQEETIDLKEIDNIQERIRSEEYDETGAKREYFFHKHLGMIIDSYVEVSEDGYGIKLNDTKKEDIYIIGISANELARANKEASHEGGDSLLNETVSLGKNILQTDDIYHLFGADFISIKNNSENIDQIRNTPLTFHEGCEPAKTTVVSLSLEQAINNYNLYLEKLKEENDELELEKIKNNPKKYFASYLMSILQFDLEVEKNKDLVSRLKAILKENPEEAADYYEKYLSYIFIGESWETFSNEDDESIMEKCIEFAQRRVFETDVIPYKIWTNLENPLQDIAFQLYEKQRQQKFSIEKEEKIIEEFTNNPSDESAFKKEQQFFVLERKTVLDNLREIAQIDYENASLAELGSYAVKVKFFIDNYLPNLDQEPFYSILQKDLERIYQLAMNKSEGTKDAEDWTFSMHIEKVTLITDELLLRYDYLTAMPNKYECYRTLDSWWDEIDEKGEFSVVSIDMGFIKYFNFQAGREVGDLAIKKSAWLINEIRDKFNSEGIETEAFRVSGDEFVLLVRKQKEIAERIIEELQRESQELNPITEQPNGLILGGVNSKSTYRPEMLSFDIGIMDSIGTRELLKDLSLLEVLSDEEKTRIESGNYDKKLLIEVQTKSSDIISEINKSRSRFQLLFSQYAFITDAMESETLTGQESKLRWEQYIALLNFSGKALSGKKLEDFYNFYEYAVVKGYDPLNLTTEQLDDIRHHFLDRTTITTIQQDKSSTLTTVLRDILSTSEKEGFNVS